MITNSAPRRVFRRIAVAGAAVLAVGAVSVPMLASASAVTPSKATAATVTPQKTGDHKITLCHATASKTNPYVKVTVDVSSAGVIRGGHAKHTGPVFDPAEPVKGWGDVIPPYDYTKSNGAVVHVAGLNWTTDGRAIYDAGCKVVTPPADVHVTVPTPTAVDATCEAQGSLTLPAVTGVAWKVEDVATAAGTHAVDPGTYHVVATAQAGYVIDGTSAWTLTVAAATGCEPGLVTVAVPAPAAVDQTCTATGYITLEAVTGATWTLDGNAAAAGRHNVLPGTHTVKATADKGYTLTGVSTFSLTVKAATGCTEGGSNGGGSSSGTTPTSTSLAHTGVGNPLLWGLTGALLLLLGTALQAASRRSTTSVTE